MNQSKNFFFQNKNQNDLNFYKQLKKFGNMIIREDKAQEIISKYEEDKEKKICDAPIKKKTTNFK